jgi:hypothetical protein
MFQVEWLQSAREEDENTVTVLRVWLLPRRGQP